MDMGSLSPPRQHVGEHTSQLRAHFQARAMTQRNTFSLWLGSLKDSTKKILLVYLECMEWRVMHKSLISSPPGVLCLHGHIVLAAEIFLPEVLAVLLSSYVNSAVEHYTNELWMGDSQASCYRQLTYPLHWCDIVSNGRKQYCPYQLFPVKLSLWYICIEAKF